MAGLLGESPAEKARKKGEEIKRQIAALFSDTSLPKEVVKEILDEIADDAMARLETL